MATQHVAPKMPPSSVASYPWRIKWTCAKCEAHGEIALRPGETSAQQRVRLRADHSQTNPKCSTGTYVSTYAIYRETATGRTGCVA